MKKYALCLIITVMMVGCSNNGETIAERIQKTVEAQNIAPPQQADFKKQLPDLSPEFLQQTAQHHNDPILYQKNLGKTYYYTVDGNLTDKPQPQGFYRQVMGMTNNGLTVVQDFYQNSKQPQTAVFTIKRGGDETSFDTKEANGRMIWFKPTDELSKLQEIANGQPVGYSILFKDKSILAMAAVGENKYCFFHPHSQTILAYIETLKQNPQMTDMTLFRADGSAIIKSQRDTQGQWHHVAAWDEKGKSVKPKKVATETDKLFEQAKADMKQLIQYAKVT